MAVELQEQAKQPLLPLQLLLCKQIVSTIYMVNKRPQT
jgi:hypothetical protein